MRTLAIDYGSRRIGLALSDEDGCLATPLCTIVRKGAGLEEVARRLEEARATAVVLGLPLRTDGREGPEARRVRDFGSRLERRTEVPVSYWDERFTTVVAQRQLREVGVSERKGRQLVDQVAAVALLQSFLDARAAASESRPSNHSDPDAS